MAAEYAVRRLGMAPCAEATYNNIVKREALVRAGVKDALAKFDKALADAKAKAKAKGAKPNEGIPTTETNSEPEGGTEK